jgi:glutathionyl-hydroquinone reductase
MIDPDNARLRGSNDWRGMRELDEAIAENRLTAYTWKKAWADPWERRALILAGLLGLAFVIYVAVYDGLL